MPNFTGLPVFETSTVLCNNAQWINVTAHNSSAPETNDKKHWPDHHDDDVIEPAAYLSVTLIVFYGIIFLLGLVGNVMVILVVAWNKTMRSSTNLYLVNLSIADLSVILVCMPAGLHEFFFEDVWYLGDVMCK